MCVRLYPTVSGLAFGACGGGLFHLLGMPMPWMLGAMTFTLVAGLGGFDLRMERGWRNAFVPVLGVMLGSLFNPASIGGFTTVAVMLPLVLAHLAIAVGLGYVFFRRVVGFDPVTSYFSAIPGNFSAMVVAADALGADIRSVTLVHASRLVIAISLVSFSIRYGLGVDTTMAMHTAAIPLTLVDGLLLIGCAVAGYAAGKAIRLPVPQMFGPLILSALVHATGLTDSAPPQWLIWVAQVFIGTFVGTRFTGVRLSEVAGIITLSALWAIILLVVIGGFVAVVVHILEMPPLELLLAFAPGGAAEMSLIAISIGVNITFVTTVQLVRIVLAVTLAPLLIRRHPSVGLSRQD